MRRIGLGVIDQALASASNVLFVLVLGRVLSPADFGYHALAYTAITVVVAVVAGAFGTLILTASGDHADVRSQAAGALSWVGLITLPLAGAATVALAVAETPVTPLLALGLGVLPLQSIPRFTAPALGRAATAVLADALWCVTTFALMAATWAGVTISAEAATVTWLGAATASGMLARRLLGLPLLRRGLRAWLLDQAADRGRFGAEASVGSASSLIVAFAVTGFVGPGANAAIRGASTLLGPINVLITSIRTAVVPVLSRQEDKTFAHLSRVLLPLTLTIGAVSIGVTAFALWLPESLGALLLGDSWVLVAPVLAIYGVEYLGQALFAHSTAIAVSRADSRAVLSSRIVLAIAQLTACLTAAIVFASATAVATASAVAVWITSVVVTVAIARGIDRR